MANASKLLIGSWLNAIGTILVALTEINELRSDDRINDKIISIGEVLESVGSYLMAIDEKEEADNFTGNMMESVGSTIAAIGNYTLYLDPSSLEDGLAYEIIGDLVQAIGSSISAYKSFENEDEKQLLGNVLQSLGAGLEALGAYFELEGNEGIGNFIAAKGAIIQSVGSVIFASVTTRAYAEEKKSRK